MLLTLTAQISELVEIAPTIASVVLAESVPPARTERLTQVVLDLIGLALKLELHSVLPTHRFLADLALNYHFPQELRLNRLWAILGPLGANR